MPGPSAWTKYGHKLEGYLCWSELFVHASFCVTENGYTWQYIQLRIVFTTLLINKYAKEMIKSKDKTIVPF